MTQHIIGFIRVILPRYTEAGQRQAMDAHNISTVIQDGGKQRLGTMADVLQMIEPRRRTVAVLHAMLLADPRHDRKRGGSRAAFWKALDAIEARGGIVWELYTGLRTDKPGERDKMTRAAIDALARGRHKTRQSDRRGRPPKADTVADTDKAKAKTLWESRKLKTWAAVRKKLPRGITTRDCWNWWGARSSETTDEE